MYRHGGNQAERVQARPKQFLISVGILLAAISWHTIPAYGDGGIPIVYCYSPFTTIHGGGGSGTAYVNCNFYSSETGNNYQLFNSANNFLAPAALVLQNGTNRLIASLQASVVSPDNTVTEISGTANGFTGSLLSTSFVRTLQFQYLINTTAQTTPGLYSSYATNSYYQYRICTSHSCQEHVYSGTAPFNLSVNVQSTPTTVSCESPPVDAAPGGGAFNLNVTCTISGSDARQLSSASQNLFSPATITLSQGGKTIAAALQPTVTSPDNTVTNISGTASGGFTGNINSLPAKVMVQYQGTTTATTPAGTYTSSPVTFTWSTI